MNPIPDRGQSDPMVVARLFQQNNVEIQLESWYHRATEFAAAHHPQVHGRGSTTRLRTFL